MDIYGVIINTQTTDDRGRYSISGYLDVYQIVVVRPDNYIQISPPEPVLVQFNVTVNQTINIVLRPPTGNFKFELFLSLVS